MGFIDLGVEGSLVGLLTEDNILEPTQVQQLAISKIAAGESLIVRSQTGSGKTLAYLLPIIQRLMQCDDERVLILLPTRELAQQVGRVCGRYAEVVGLQMAVIYGGVEYDGQREQMAENPRIVVATPGRLQDLILQGVVDLEGVENFVIDEVDQMVEMGFRDPILELSKLRAEGAQSLCFSATLRDDVMAIIGEIAPSIEVVECEGQMLAAQRITQLGYYVEQSMMDQLLLHLIRTKSPRKSIVFCRSKKMADRLTSILKESGFAAEAIHSDRSQAAREHILRRFVEGETVMLVATDLMARGIDVDGVTHVFNYGLPQNPEQYIHRIGRTGRAGEVGEAISLLCPDEKKMLDATCSLMRQHITISIQHPYVTSAVTTMMSGVPLRKKSRK